MSDMAIILRSLRQRLFSTVTTVLMVGVAVGLLLLLLSMRDAGRRAFERGSGNVHLIVSRDASPLVAVLNGVFYANAPARAIEWSRYQQIAESHPLDFAIPLQQGDSFRGSPVLATTPAFFAQFRPHAATPWELTSGRFFEGDFEAVLGAQAARASKLRVGDKIFLTHGMTSVRGRGDIIRAGAARGQDHDDHADHDDHDHDHDHAAPHVHREFPYTVVGVLAPSGSAHDRAIFTSLTSSWLTHAHDRRLREDPKAALPTPADLTESDRLITGIYLRAATRPGSDTSAVLPQVFDALRRDPSITVASPTQQIAALFQIVSNIDQLFLAMAAVVLLASSVSILLALYNSMELRRRQVAILRVLGFGQWRIFSLVVTEAAFIGLLGALAGLALSAGGMFAVTAVMKQRLGLVIEPQLGLNWALAVAAGAVLLAAAAGLVPALAAYRTSVARHLQPIA